MPKPKRIGYRPTWAEINLNNLAHNFRQIKKLLAKDVLVMCTVKADAYGHGLVPVAKRLVSCGADYLGVASIDEAIKLRDAGVKLPILVLGIVLKSDIEPLFKYGLTPSVSSLDFAACLNKKARLLKRRLKVHLKVDTGMGRAGVLQKDAFDFTKKVSRLNFLEIEGVYTHFAFADLDKKFTRYQIRLFYQLLKKLKKAGIIIPLAHAANSSGVIDFKDSHFKMVRPGLALYGLKPKQSSLKLKPVLSLKSRVVYAKRVPAGYGISYAHTYTTSGESTIVVLPIGYGDGYPRNLSNTAPVLIKGRRFRISGTVCMDQIMVDVGHAKVKPGDEAVLIGKKGNNKISAEELAKLAGTIPYEIVCGLGSRIPRVFVA